MLIEGCWVTATETELPSKPNKVQDKIWSPNWKIRKTEVLGEGLCQVKGQVWTKPQGSDNKLAGQASYTPKLMLMWYMGHWQNNDFLAKTNTTATLSTTNLAWAVLTLNGGMKLLLTTHMHKIQLYCWNCRGTTLICFNSGISVISQVFSFYKKQGCKLTWQQHKGCKWYLATLPGMCESM